MRRNDANATTILKIVNHFLSIFENMKVSSDNADGLDITNSMCMRFTAAITLQILKLGTKIVDKLVFKELVKVLGALNTDWIKPNIASTVARVIAAISEQSSEKTNEKVFEKYFGICGSLLGDIDSEVSEEVGPDGFQFLSLAPGLADLVDTEAAFITKKLVKTVTAATTKAKSTKTRKPTNKDESDNDDENEEVNDENVEIRQSEITQSSRPSRSAKAAASAKIVEQMEKIAI
jgi:hypothetical protein